MGAKLVFPGRFLAPVSLAHLMEEERITVAAGVPTIWIGMLAALESETFDLSACGLSTVVDPWCRKL